MKNHFARTGLAPDIRAEDIDAELDLAGASEDALLVADVAAARAVLTEPTRRMHYDRAYRHYRAMAVALDTLEAPIATDSHRWSERLVEFEPDVGQARTPPNAP